MTGEGSAAEGRAGSRSGSYMETGVQGLSPEVFRDIENYIEEVKELLSSELWENIFLNCTKNEVLIYWLLFRKNEVKMSEIAEYIHVPLNTATGIVSRMENNGLVVRSRSAGDKRVVLICFSEKGRMQFQKLFDEVMYYGMQVLGSLTREETELFRKMTAKVLEVLKQEHRKEESVRKVRKITIE
ncbi:MAG: MarR family transcriptional regulator [Lachnospiraceae bacterium]|nr:MarR family transcriptional regulator [Lachnospiraceae bacterium]